MNISVALEVKGTQYYEAAKLFKKGKLYPNLEIKLKHEPNNKFDKNAVAVVTKNSCIMLGYVAKRLSSKYAKLINNQKIIKTIISNIYKNGSYINIDIQIVYDQAQEELNELYSTHFWLSTSDIIEGAGVYAIRNINSNKLYIGSSINVKKRVHAHIKNLFYGTHHNHILQSDFIKIGANLFEVDILVEGPALSNLRKLEAEQISLMLESNVHLYNMTKDGGGTGWKYNGGESTSVSDRRMQQQARAKQNQINKVFSDKKEKIINEYNQKLSLLFTQSSFWESFIWLFIGFISLFLFIFPSMTKVGVLVLSSLLAYIGSHIYTNSSIEMTKKNPNYQKLTKQRDKQLEKLENEHKQNIENL